jgi:hypothetical protein
MGGPNLRYRIEIAAAFLAHVIEHAYDAAVANGGDPERILRFGAEHCHSQGAGDLRAGRRL